MEKLLEGIHHFRSTVFASQRELFERLADGQAPATLFITCSDSRVDPQLLTQTPPGQLFVLRNAGNLIPAWSGETNSEAATIEFAVAGLKVQDIIVCGHSHCGAVKALLDPSMSKGLPMLERWLVHAHATKRIIDENYAQLTGDEKVLTAIGENVLMQVENLQTHPAVASRLAAGTLSIHAWVYLLESGRVIAFDRKTSTFSPVESVALTPPASRAVAFDF